jgi:SAM-dependent methyltransferase
MIKVLQNWEEIGLANKSLGRGDLPKHRSAEKNWDLYHLYTLAQPLPRATARIIDLGCAGSHTLKFLHALGFLHLFGVDLAPNLTDRLFQLREMFHRRRLTPSFRITRGDLTRTRFPDAHFDLAVCLSVIEHGVDLEAFLAEASRLLKPGGQLFITTDYWESPLTPAPGPRPFNLPWKVYSKTDLQVLLARAARFGFTPGPDPTLPPCSDKPVVWNGLEYTFLCLVLQKSPA